MHKTAQRYEKLFKNGILEGKLLEISGNLWERWEELQSIGEGKAIGDGGGEAIGDGGEER